MEPIAVPHINVDTHLLTATPYVAVVLTASEPANLFRYSFPPPHRISSDTHPKASRRRFRYLELVSPRLAIY